MRLLITGGKGFTGRHLIHAAKRRDYEIHTLQSDITHEENVFNEIKNIVPDYVIHLAALSHVVNADENFFYKVNLFGTTNLLKALLFSRKLPQKILLISSANIYGNNSHSPLAETDHPMPTNHYAMSKLSMEYMALNYLNELPISIIRPFNYTGVGQSAEFVIPKIIQAFKLASTEIELGNIDVEREYNDVRVFCEAYLDLLKLAGHGEKYNLCSGNAFSLKEVIILLENMTHRAMKIKINQNLMRKNEVFKLYGCPHKLEGLIGKLNHQPFENTLNWMLTH
jgi:nucleoside-diphosphate-sugar epimerase